jgi:hypothetical protein
VTQTKEDLAEKARLYRSSHPDYERSIKIKRYGITLDEYDRMVEERGGRCDICGQVPEKRLHVDHDHSCCPGRNSCGNCIRGLLCSRCSLTLGAFHDDIELLRSAIIYLGGGDVQL